MDEVAHLHIQKQRLIRIFHIESIKRAVLRNYGHVGFTGEVPDGSLHTDDVLRTVGFPGNQVGRAQVHIAHFRGEEDMHGLAVCHLQTVGRYHAVKGQFPGQTVV